MIGLGGIGEIGCKARPHELGTFRASRLGERLIHGYDFALRVDDHHGV